MNIIDVVIIFGLLLGGVSGARNGVFKQLVVLIGTVLCFVFAFLLKDFLANFLSYTLPFFNFAGPLKGLTSLNIIMYQLIAFMILMALFSSGLVVLIKVTGGFEKFLKFTIVLGIPSKILGFVVGVIEAYVILFAILFFMNQPAFNFDVFNESRFTDVVLVSSPGLSNIVKDTNDAVFDVYSITKDYNDSNDSLAFNKRIVNCLKDHKVIDDRYLNELRRRGKINY